MRFGRRRIVLAVVLAILVGLGAWAGYRAVRLWGHVASLRATLPRLEALAKGEGLGDLQPAQFAALKDEFATLAADVTAIEAEVAPVLPLTRLFGWVPKYGADIRAAPALLDMASGVVKAGAVALDGVEPLIAAWKEPPAESSASLLERIVPALIEAEPQLAEATVHLGEVMAARATLGGASLSPQVQGLVQRLDDYLPLLKVGVQGARIAPKLLGAEGPRTYLVIAQNNHELRATGGFISGVGLLRLDQGRIVELSFQDSYGVDDYGKLHPPPPDALLKYMKAEILVLRDANWWADFPTSAQVLASIYAIDQGIVVDGVIAADLTAVRWMVKALEPLQLEGIDQPVTGDNVLDFMQLAWGAPQDAPALAEGAQSDRNQWRQWLRHRKDFMGLLLGAMRGKLEGGQDVELGRVLSTVKSALDEKHVLIHVDDVATADLLTEAGWTGALRPGDGDFLMVVDTNMGFNKVNARIEQATTYEVLLDEAGAPVAKLTLHYHHTASIKLDECVHEAYYGTSYDDMMNRCYWDYVRVYVPGESQLLETSGLDPGSAESLPGEAGTRVLAGFFVMKPGEEHEISFRYRLPPGVVGDAAYRLRVQKQPGVNALPLRVVVSGMADADFETRLFTDHEFLVPLGG
jgi:hypothetical protein